MPYAILTGVVSLLLGDLPTGYEAYPEEVGLVLGIAAVCLIAYLISAPITGTTSDMLTRALRYAKTAKSMMLELRQTRADTKNPVHEYS